MTPKSADEPNTGDPKSPAASSALALRVTVRGRVQGVGYRDFVYTRARWLGLAGYVRNLPGGRAVEVIAEGPRESLEQLIEHLREGPRMSRVDAVDVEWAEPTGRYRDFGMRF